MPTSACITGKLYHGALGTAQALENEANGFCGNLRQKKNYEYGIPALFQFVFYYF